MSKWLELTRFTLLGRRMLAQVSASGSSSARWEAAALLRPHESGRRAAQRKHNNPQIDAARGKHKQRRNRRSTPAQPPDNSDSLAVAEALPVEPPP